MKQTTKEVIDKLSDEYNALVGRIGSLERFMICKDYQKVTEKQKDLLARQRAAMEDYKEILVRRLIDLREQEQCEKYMDMRRASEAPMQEAESGTSAD